MILHRSHSLPRDISGSSLNFCRHSKRGKRASTVLLTLWCACFALTLFDCHSWMLWKLSRKSPAETWSRTSSLNGQRTNEGLIERQAPAARAGQLYHYWRALNVNCCKDEWTRNILMINFAKFTQPFMLNHKSISTYPWYFPQISPCENLTTMTWKFTHRTPNFWALFITFSCGLKFESQASRRWW